MNIEITKDIKLLEKIKSVISAKSALYIDKYQNLSNVSSSFAKKLQKAHLDLLNKDKNEIFTPIHKIIINQLQIENEQIRHAAVYNLINIANNNLEYRKDIVRELKRYSKKISDSFPSVKLANEFINEYRINRDKLRKVQ